MYYNIVISSISLKNIFYRVAFATLFAIFFLVSSSTLGTHAQRFHYTFTTVAVSTNQSFKT